MLRPCLLVRPLATSIPNMNCDYIGVDAGAYLLAKNKIMMERSIGDFDSCDKDYLELIKKYSIKCIQLNPIKDESDLEEAIRLAKSLDYQNIFITGALGKRMDHTFCNLRILENEKEAKIIFIDPKNRMEVLKRGTYYFDHQIYKYFSIFALEDSVISLEGFKYPLENRLITTSDIYTLSNEIVIDKAKLTIHQGKVLVIQAND